MLTYSAWPCLGPAPSTIALSFPPLNLHFSCAASGDAGGDDAAAAGVQGQAAEGRQDRRMLTHQRADRSHDRDTRRPRGADQVRIYVLISLCRVTHQVG